MKLYGELVERATFSIFLCYGKQRLIDSVGASRSFAFFVITLLFESD